MSFGIYYMEKLHVLNYSFPFTISGTFCIFTDAQENHIKEVEKMASERGSMMDEALRILHEEGFTLPDDVTDTLLSFSNTDHQDGDKYVIAHGMYCTIDQYMSGSPF